MSALATILEDFPQAGRDKLIPILQAVQDEEGFLSREAVTTIGKHLSLPSSKIYGVATFYNQFRFRPLGQCHIQVCRGTACHVKGSAELLKRIERELGISAGETTADGLFSIEVVACIGACGLAPVIAANGTFHAKVEPDDVESILNNLREQCAEKKD